jgi:hypothetical protein
MIQTQTITLDALASVAERLKAAREIEPHPLHPADGEVEAFVAALLAADDEITKTLLRGGETLREAEIKELERKRGSISANIARQAMLAGRRMSTDREGSMETLDALFEMGRLPNPTLDGRYRGELVSLTMQPMLDSAGKGLARFWMPWMGKRFNSAAQSGDNVVMRSASIVGHLFWPTFFDYRPYKPGLYTVFDFRTYTGPSLGDADKDVLKLDYDNESNPGFLVRAVVDEVVQLSDDYYLGKAFLKGSKGYKLAAFFALRRFE